MIRRRAAAGLIALAMTGCPTGPSTILPTEVDLSKVQRFRREGKAEEAAAELARLVKLLADSGRTDVKAHCAWGRILHLVHRLEVRKMLAKATPELRRRCEPLSPWMGPEGDPFLLAGSAGHWTHVLKAGADPVLLVEGAGAIADLLDEKIGRPELRRGRLEPADKTADLLYRRFLEEAVVDLRCYALARSQTTGDPELGEPAAVALDRYAASLRELAAAPDVKSEAAQNWTERAAGLERQAQVIRKAPGLFELSPDLRRSIEADPDDLLRLAIEHANVANREVSRRGDDTVILESFERALRHFVAARECLVEPSTLQKRILDTMPIAADGLRRHAFEK